MRIGIAGDATKELQNSIIDNLISSETPGTYLHPDGVTEQDAVDITPAEIINYRFLLLDLSNLVQNTTVKVYVKIDGTNYRCIDSAIYPTDFPTGATSAKIELLTSSRDMKVTLQSAIADGAVRNVPYVFSYKSEA